MRVVGGKCSYDGKLGAFVTLVVSGGPADQNGIRQGEPLRGRPGIVLGLWGRGAALWCGDGGGKEWFGQYGKERREVLTSVEKLTCRVEIDLTFVRNKLPFLLGEGIKMSETHLHRSRLSLPFSGNHTSNHIPD